MREASDVLQKVFQAEASLREISWPVPVPSRHFETWRAWTATLLESECDVRTIINSVAFTKSLATEISFSPPIILDLNLDPAFEPLPSKSYLSLDLQYCLNFPTTSRDCRQRIKLLSNAPQNNLLVAWATSSAHPLAPTHMPPPDERP